MKKVILIVFSVCLTSAVFAQAPSERPARITIVKGGESTPVKATEKAKLTPAQELESCLTQLEALNKKEEFIRSNPEELKLAEENGWFIDAAITRARLEKRIGELKLELKK